MSQEEYQFDEASVQAIMHWAETAQLPKEVVLMNLSISTTHLCMFGRTLTTSSSIIRMRFNVPSGGSLDLPNGSRIENYGAFSCDGTVNNNGVSSTIYNEGLFTITNYGGVGWLRGM